MTLTRLAAGSEKLLESVGAVGELRLLAERGDHAYYRMAGLNGQPCFAMGPARPRSIGTAQCLKSADAMPSAVVDMSEVVLDPSTRAIVRFERIEGIAADGVASIALEDGGVMVATAPVVKNTYRLDHAQVPPTAPDAIVALDGDGAVLWRGSVGP